MQTHLADIVAVGLEVETELGVLLADGVLTDVWKQEQGQAGTEHAQSRGDEEWVLASLDRVGVGIAVVQDSEDTGTDERANLAKGGSNTVVLATNGGGGRLGCDETNVVAGSQFTEGEEDAVHDDEAADVLDLGKGGVAASHDETDDCLGEHTVSECVTWSDPVADKATKNAARHVEEVDKGVPAEGNP